MPRNVSAKTVLTVVRVDLVTVPASPDRRDTEGHGETRRDTVGHNSGCCQLWWAPKDLNLDLQDFTLPRCQLR